MESGKSWTLLKLDEFCKNEENVLEFLKNRGLISKTMNCPKCGWGMKMVIKEKYWRCYKTVKTKKGKKICKKTVTINKDTWFSKTKLSYEQVLKITYMIVNNYEQKMIARELKISKSKVSQLNLFIKQVMKDWCEFNSEPTGGQGKIVEVDLSKAHFMFKKNAKKINKDIFDCILEEISKIKFYDTTNLDEGSKHESEEEEEDHECD